MHERLRTVPLFAALSDEDLMRLCEGAEAVTLPSGTELFAEGDAGDSAYVITHGEVEIVKVSGQRQVLLAVRTENEVIGEMALLEEAPRMATARARTDAELISIPKARFDELLATSITALRAMFQVLLERWQATQGQLRQSERMAQLGTLTAGLAHELNNPAAAVNRAAGLLRRELDVYRSTLSGLATAGLDAPGEKALASLLERVEEDKAGAPSLSPVARADAEERLEDLLAGLGVEEPWEAAEALVDLGLDMDDLAGPAAAIGSAGLPGAVRLLAASHETRRLAAEIEEGSQRLSAIVKALKSYSYLDQAPVQDVDLVAGLEDTLLILKPKLEGITVRREFAADLPRIEAHGSRLNQVWTNLIDNAADAVREVDRTDGEIVLRAYPQDDTVIVEVEDNGTGIPPETVHRVFDSFYTTKPPGSGTGLGLNISYGIIVHEHRGDITVESVPGKTTFRVELPITGPKETS